MITIIKTTDWGAISEYFNSWTGQLSNSVFFEVAYRDTTITVFITGVGLKEYSYIFNNVTWGDNIPTRDIIEYTLIRALNQHSEETGQ